MNVSLGIGATGSHVPYESLVELRAAYMPGCRSGRLQGSPELIRRKWHPPVSTSPNPLSTLHRRFAYARLSQPCLPGYHVPTFPRRSPPSLLTTAACGGLRPAPDCRPRRALLHLSYSSAPSYSDGAFVTHDPNRTFGLTRLGQPGRFSPWGMAEMLRVGEIGGELRC